MDINYRILWFEDTDESFDALGRRTKRYVESQNLRCTIDRLQGVSEFDSKKPDINSYEILVVDLKLSEESKGYSIIETIRQSNFVNDILFYSSDGVAVLESILKEHRLEGVFITDRKNDDFMFKIQQLIDKSIRRSENVINIRGIVLEPVHTIDNSRKHCIIESCRSHNNLSENVKFSDIFYITESLMWFQKAIFDNKKGDLPLRFPLIWAIWAD